MSEKQEMERTDIPTAQHGIVEPKVTSGDTSRGQVQSLHNHTNKFTMTSFNIRRESYQLN